MYKYDSDSSTAGCIMLIIMICLLGAMCSWTDRTLDFWCTYFSHHAVDIPMWLSALVTFIGNGLALFFNVVSEIIRACM